MMSRVRVWERATRHALFGFRVWDIAAATQLVDGLKIDVTTGAQTSLRRRAFVNRSGIYSASGLPGLSQVELNKDDPVLGNKPPRRFKVEVFDPADRYLPFSFNADLPVTSDEYRQTRGLFNWNMPWTSPPQPFVFLNEEGASPVLMNKHVPLFSTPSRPVPGSLAVVRAQLREFGTDRPAAWCLVTVSIDTVIRGIGLADQEGRIAILFPYPERSLSSPLSAKNAFSWSIELTAYYVPYPADTAASMIPDLADVFMQLNSPCTLFYSTASPPQALSALPLEYRVPLTVRTEITATGKPSSFLFVNTA